MTRKSDGEKIDELMISVAQLGERVKGLQEQIQGLERDIQDLRTDLRESRQRLWLLVPPIVAAFVSAGLTAIVTYLASHR